MFGKIFANLNGNPQTQKMVMSASVVLGILFLGGTVSNSFTASSIKKSPSYSTADAGLKRAYTWSVGTAVVDAVGAALCVLGIIAVVHAKKVAKRGTPATI